MRRQLLLLILILSGLSGFTTHNRAGEILYGHYANTNQLKYWVKVNIYRENNIVVRDTLQLRVRSCATGNVIIHATLDKIASNPYPTKPNILLEEYFLLNDTLTLPGPGCYVLDVFDPNRVDGIVNMNGSVEIPFFLLDTIQILDPQFYGFNSSPILFNPPIDNASCCNIYCHNPAAIDPDGDSLDFTLITPYSDYNQPISSYTPLDKIVNSDCPPSNITIDRQTGEICWDAPPTDIGYYNLTILIREFREGVFIGSMIRDMQFYLTCDGIPPEIIKAPDDTCILAGQRLTFEVVATDQDPNQAPPTGGLVKLYAVGAPFSTTPAATFTTSGQYMDPESGIFDWTPDCSNIRPSDYIVVFRAEDNTLGTDGLPDPLVDIHTLRIKVVAPPPENLQAVVSANQVQLSWDNPYICDGAPNFRGFTIWRKKGCDSLNLDTCAAGGLAALGYKKISGLLSTYTYVDAKVSPGSVYSYRVQAEFSELSPAPGNFPYNEVSGLASLEACAEIPRSLPILTNVDVQVTDEIAGVIEVKWQPPLPDDLDTLINPGPYKYELKYAAGYTGANQIIATFTSPTFVGLTQTNFIHTGIDTRTTPHNYLLSFYATDNQGQQYKVGDSEGASSVFLEITTTGPTLDLVWDEVVPWDNFSYEIFKETPTGSNNFLSIANTAGSAYTDDDVEIGELYCYKIRSYGSYYSPTFPDTLINNSQVACAIPIDTIAPCAPPLSLTNDCLINPENLNPLDLANILTWQKPDPTCGDDVAFYRVYFKETPLSTYQLIHTTPNAEELEFIHQRTNSLAGCYVITAVDTFSNESQYSNEICAENCPLYTLPNVFTPNGDGSNELFIPYPYQFVDHIVLKVYNRNGNLVFETEDPDINWDGTHFKTKKPLPEAVYFYSCEVYEIRLDGIIPIDKPLSGYIHLIRGNN